MGEPKKVLNSSLGIRKGIGLIDQSIRRVRDACPNQRWTFLGKHRTTLSAANHRESEHSPSEEW
jgi:hypothetical protein